MSLEKIQQVEKEIFELTQKLNVLRAESPSSEVPDYGFTTLQGDTTLRQLFAGRRHLMVIHNMGQACRYCTLWGDGINGFLPHLESVLSVVLISKDAPEVQRRFANSRHWQFQMVSHAGGAFMQEQSPSRQGDNAPGVSLYELQGDKVLLKNRSQFGPYDQFCAIWHLLSLAGLDAEGWTPQYNYWTRPEKMDDGGQNLN